MYRLRTKQHTMRALFASAREKLSSSEMGQEAARAESLLE